MAGATTWRCQWNSSRPADEEALGQAKPSGEMKTLWVSSNLQVSFPSIPRLGGRMLKGFDKDDIQFYDQHPWSPHFSIQFPFAVSMTRKTGKTMNQWQVLMRAVMTLAMNQSEAGENLRGRGWSFTTPRCGPWLRKGTYIYPLVN